MGRFIALKVSNEDLKNIKKFQQEINLNSPVKEDDIHCTLFSTTDNFDYVSDTSYLPLKIIDLKLGKIKTQTGVDCLALFFDNEVLQLKYTTIKETYGVKPFYDNLKLHITLSYDCGDLDIEKIDLSQYLQSLELVEEYNQELKFEVNRRLTPRE